MQNTIFPFQKCLTRVLDLTSCRSLQVTFHPAECPITVRPSKMRIKGRPAKRAKQKAPRAEEKYIKNQITDTSDLKGNICYGVHLLLPLLCCFVYHTLSALQGSDLQPMLSLQWDAALEQWASKVSPKLASPHLSVAFCMFQDAAFVCALAWSVSIFLPFMGDVLSFL